MNANRSTLLSGFYLFRRCDVELSIELARRGLRRQLSNRAIGMLWMVIEPAALISIIWFIFYRNIGVGQGADYFLYLSTGFIAWNYFSNVLAHGTHIFIKYKYLLTQTSTNPLVTLFATLLEQAFGHLIVWALLFVVALILGWRPGLEILALPFVFLGLNIVAGSAVLLAATLNVFLRDVTNVVQIVSRFGFWLLPIIWKIESVSGVLYYITLYNPLYSMIEAYRWLFGLPAFQQFSLGVVFVQLAIVMAIVSLSVLIYVRLRPHLVEFL